jgi:hypothetical protein
MKQHGFNIQKAMDERILTPLQLSAKIIYAMEQYRILRETVLAYVEGRAGIAKLKRLVK